MVQINPRQFGDQLPYLPPLDIEQDNIPLNPPNQPQDLSAGEDNNQQHQVEEPNLLPEPEELEQPNPPPNQPISTSKSGSEFTSSYGAPTTTKLVLFQARVFRKARGRCRRAPSQDQ